MDSYKIIIPYLPIKANSRYMKRVFEKLGVKSLKSMSFKHQVKEEKEPYYVAKAYFEGITKKEWDTFFIHLDWNYKVYIQHKYGKIRLLKFEEKQNNTIWSPMEFEKPLLNIH